MTLLCRSRSRTPSPLGDRSPCTENFLESSLSSSSFASRMRHALARKVSTTPCQCPAQLGESLTIAEDIAGTEVEVDEHEAVEQEIGVDGTLRLPPSWPCPECQCGFVSQGDLVEHFRSSLICLADLWQSSVSNVACLPGAGQTLWCPACPLVGQWTVAAIRAPSLLRHLSAVGAEGLPRGPPHRRLADTIVNLALEGRCDQRSQLFGDSRLADIAGPLLTKPSLQTRTAVLRLMDTVLGNVGGFAMDCTSEGIGESDKLHNCENRRDFIGEEVGNLRILGRDLTVEGSGLYDEDVPLDVGCVVVSVDARVEGCPLPAGGLAALRMVDLISSSEDEAAPDSEDTSLQDPLAASCCGDCLAREQMCGTFV